MYSIIKGNLFTLYNGTDACTGLSVHAVVNTKEEARIVVKELFNKETSLILVIDSSTGLKCEDV